MINRIKEYSMFTTIITIQNTNTKASSFEAFNTLYQEFIGPEAEDELNYIRSDMIMDGKMKEECYKGWDNETKTATFIHYHEKNEDRRDYQLALTTNQLSIEAQKKLAVAGWNINITNSTAENTAQANKLHIIDEWALEGIRPERKIGRAHV